ncbi:MAG TPA: SPFH domain-containing protein [Candidatus Hydrogenedentes bacterium]|nr:SPFH domain-containing protein [Candidatus Hydrogenedentota bacterium]
MGLFDNLRGELIDIIEWLDESGDSMVHRFERYNNEIKYGAKLIVREGQVAVFIDRGKLADVFDPGMYTLETANLPILSTLLGWAHGFESPFKAEVYFVSTKQFTDLKWGTKNPIIARDPEFGPVRLRAFGTFCIRVMFAPTFIREIVGTSGSFTMDEIQDQLRNMIVARFADIIGESKLPVLDMAANYDELGKFITERILDDFDQYGLQVTKLLVENISLPPEVEEALDKRTSMGVIGNLNAYSQYQAATAMTDAAKNPGAGGAMGMGVGMMMANQVGGVAAASLSAPPPVPGGASVFIAVDGQQSGPYDNDGLKLQIKSGRLTRDSLVWKEGMAEWTAAGAVPDVAKLFGAVPPPVPPKV